MLGASPRVRTRRPSMNFSRHPDGRWMCRQKIIVERDDDLRFFQCVNGICWLAKGEARAGNAICAGKSHHNDATGRQDIS